MKRLRVEVHDRQINISLPEAGVLSAWLAVVDRSDKESWDKDEVSLELSGLDSVDGRHPHWGTFELAPGDKVTIEVHDDRIADTPDERRGPTRQQDENAKRKYVRKLAAELGWSIVEP